MTPSSGSAESTTRVGVWRDLIREHFVALDIHPERADPFTGAVRNRHLGHLDVATVDSTAQRCRRTPGLVRRDSEAWFQVGLITRGGARLEQDGREAVLGVGDFAIYETDRPFAWDLHGDWQLRVFTWPRTSVSVGAAESARLTARAVAGSGGVGGLVARLLRDMADEPPDLTAAGGARLADEVAELVTTAAGEYLRGEPPGGRADLLRRIDAHIAQNLADPELGPVSIAAAHYLSTRQLHRLFAQRGGTVSDHVRRLRLERCRRELIGPRAEESSIADIARRWGFADPATFTRSFRSAYRTTPSDYRARHRRPADPLPGD